MNRVLLSGGVTAVALMTGGCASGTTSSGAASGTSTGPPSGGPAGGPSGNMVKYADFKGVTTDGTVIPDLFAVHSTGVSTAGVISAGAAFLAALSTEQKQQVLYEVESDQWLNWSNIHSFQRKGMQLKGMTAAQQKAALAMLAAGLSARGLTLTENIRKLNHVAGRLLGKLEEFDETLYYFTVMGTPSDSAPWGFQFQGHHLVVNYFVLGDQVVMTPSFWGSEPTKGYYDDGTEIELFTTEIETALGLVNALDDAQKAKAITSDTKEGSNEQAGAGQDNVEVPYTGIQATALNAAQQAKLLALAEVFVGNMAEGHAKAKLAEVEKHLDDTYFAWVGPTDADAVFYFKLQSPVILIEFDCQGGGPASGAVEPALVAANATATAVASRGGGQGGASRNHIHCVVRTPNGNDYGFDLLKEHLATAHATSSTG